MYCVSEIELEVRYYETDQMGIVHHSNYIRYFECGRHKFLTDAGLHIMKIEELGVLMPVVSAQLNYRIPAKMGDILKIVTWVEKEPMARIEVKTIITNQNGQKICDGEVVLGFINRTTRRPIRVPQFFLDALKSVSCEGGIR